MQDLLGGIAIVDRPSAEIGAADLAVDNKFSLACPELGPVTTLVWNIHSKWVPRCHKTVMEI
jgi:hypothetical protein